MSNALLEKRCVACEGGTEPLTTVQITQYLKQITDWTYDLTTQRITKTYRFRNYYQTIAFVNAIAWVANYENHHPDLEVAFNQCIVHYTTHAIDGLSENDFICAAKTDLLYEKRPGQP